MNNLKGLLFIAILLCAARGLFAQETVNKGDVTIHIVDRELTYKNGKFLMDVYKKGDKVKITYAYLDSIKYSEIGKDSGYKPLNNNLKKHKYDDDQKTCYLILDSLGRFFDRHTDYTKDSITINLKRDTAYRNLLLRIAKTSSIELQQKGQGSGFCYDSPYFTIITSEGIKTAHATAPTENDSPLLYKLLESSLNESKDIKAVKKTHQKFGYPAPK